MRGTDSAVQLQGQSRRGRKDALFSGAALAIQPDQRLVELARAGSTGAFDAYVRRYRRPIVNYAASIVGADRAEDIAQQTFVKTLEALRGDVDPSKAWLYRVAHNFAIDALRKKANSYEQLGDEHIGTDQPQTAIEDKQKFSKLISTIAKLPERERALVVGREFEGRSLDEIAAEFGSSPAAANQLLYRVRKRLRETCGAVLPLPLLWWLLRDRSINAVSQARVASLISRTVKHGTVAKVAIAGLGFGAAAVGIGAIGVGAVDDGRAKLPAEVALAHPGASETANPGAFDSDRSTNSSAAAPGALLPGGTAEPFGDETPQSAVPIRQTLPRQETDRDPGESNPQVFTPGVDKNGPGAGSPSSGGSSGSTSSGGGGSTPPGGGGGSTPPGGGGGSTPPGGGGSTPPAWSSPFVLASTASSARVASNPSGKTVLSWVDYSDYTVHAMFGSSSARSARSSFGRQATLTAPGRTGSLESTKNIAVNDNGDVAVIWEGSLAGSYSDTKEQVEVAFTGADGNFGPAEQISGKASIRNEQIAITADGGAVAVWEEYIPGRIEAAIRPPGGKFGKAEKISGRGRAHSPALATAPNGATTVVWEEAHRSEDAVKGASRAPGGEFDTAVTLVARQDGSEVRDLSATVDPDGGATAAWTWFAPNQNSASRLDVAVRPNGDWSQATTLVDDPDVVLDAPRVLGGTQDKASVLWMQWSGGNAVVKIATGSSTGGSPTVRDLIPADEQPISYQSVVDPDGRVVAVWQSGVAGDARLRVTREDAAGGFSTPETIPGFAAANTLRCIAAGTEGRLDVFWAVPGNDLMFSSFQ